ncbi:sulfatase [Lignipirellula cremea]|uniref:Choline-sulfatase n=1 Tax=Lignipirellula cremea TaxID=2528010 RepID=A0A518DU64_9BACT|nr:sulfatase [Lignipirellula cremea]QDU95382.1 Choline-sulfatase [Lignipirellula cremea]
MQNSDALLARGLAWSWLLAISLTLAAPVAAQAADGETRPNVLFLIADDLNCDLGCYGHPLVKSPQIDALARTAVRFEQAYCQYPLCGPSRASFMTGLYPDQTRIHQNAILIRDRMPDVQTMSQMFRQAGYTAARVGKIYHYNVPNSIGSDGHDDPDSWDVKVNPIGRDKIEESKIFSLRPGSFGGTLSWLSADGDDDDQTDGKGALAAIELLTEFAQNKTPFFLAVGFYRPHTPYVAPHAYFDLYPPHQIQVPKVPEGYLETLPEPAQQALLRKKDQVNLDPKLAVQAIQAYYASISLMDAQVGRVLKSLDDLGLADNTVVLFTSDHGYHMGEHGYYQKTTLFENAAHVPLLIRAPGMKQAGGHTASFAEMVDFYPTLAELCGLTPPGNLSGVSLAPVLDDLAATPRAAALTQYGSGYSLRTPRYRYTEWGVGGDKGNELYDRKTDPAEMHNLAGDPDQADRIKELSFQLGKRIEQAQKTPTGLRQIGKP